MLTRLGLDIGTNSIGWCLFSLDEQGKPVGIRDLGVRIFSNGRDPKTGTSLAVDRRNARAQRRRRARYLRRRSALLKALIDTGLMPYDRQAAKALAVEDPYALRARALDEPLSLHHLGRALFHLNQRRGFKSNRKIARKSDDHKESGKIVSGVKALDAAMEEAKARTYGEFLFKRASNAPDRNAIPALRVRTQLDGNKDYDFYPERRHLEAEFDAIWAAQTAHHPILTDAVRDRLRWIIFFQRPLKPYQVGICTFFNDEKRLPKAHPLFQERRLYEEVNQLGITRAGAPSRKLTIDQRDKIILKLKSAKKVSFSSLAKLIKLADGEYFNKESKNRTGLTGDEIAAAFGHKNCFGTHWSHFDLDTKWSIIEKVFEEEDLNQLYAWLIETHGVTFEQAEAIGRVHLPEGYNRLGETASRKILEALKIESIDGCPLTYNEAVYVALGKSHSDFQTGEILEELPYYGSIIAKEIPPGSQNEKDSDEIRYGKITNSAVHIGLNQLRRLMNAIIRKHGLPDEIVVELCRELKQNKKAKEAHKEEIAANTKAAEARSKKLIEIGQTDSGYNRERLKLWEELNLKNSLDRCCPFCGKEIGISSLFNGETEIEHIIPYSKSFDDSSANRVIAHRICNREKGNKTPWEVWGDTERWAIIAERVSHLPEAKRWRFGADAIDCVEKEDRFLARQLTDTRYLSRLARSYLSSLYPERPSDRLPGEGVKGVYVIPGRMTAMLRRLWKLNSLLPDHNYVQNPHSNTPKNRLDHRHHIIDAAVAGVCTRGLLKEISSAAGRAEEENLDRLFDSLPTPWKTFRNDLRNSLGCIFTSYKPDHGRKHLPQKDRDITAGKLHNDTIYGLTGMKSTSGGSIVVHRKKLLDLKPGDISGDVRCFIPDTILRNALWAATEGLVGKDFEKALIEFSKNHPVFKGIRHVRVRETLEIIPIRDKNGRVYKGYKGGANARFEVWQMPNGKWVSSVVSMFDAHRLDFKPERPHPAARKVLNLRQNDMIALEKDGMTKIYRVQKFAQSGQISLIEHMQAGKMDERSKDDNDPFAFWSPVASSLKELKARQIRIDEIGRVFDPGPR